MPNIGKIFQAMECMQNLIIYKYLIDNSIYEWHGFGKYVFTL